MNNRRNSHNGSKSCGFCNKVTVTVNLIIRDIILLTLYIESIAMMMKQASLSPDLLISIFTSAGKNLVQI
jgi:hypothetical protein